MKRTSLVLPAIYIAIVSFIKVDAITIDKTQAQQAFQLLNTIRLNPEPYYKALRLNSNLKIKRTLLVWNDTLAKAAEAKAIDMTRRNYFAHVDPDGYGMNFHINKAGYKLNPDWYKNKKDNNFESIMYNAENGDDLIRTLIIDETDPTFGHRNHLLGIGEWNASLTDIGIGYAVYDSGDIHKTYISILIAKHDW